MEFHTGIGKLTIKYKPADMNAVYLSIAKWQTKNPRPSPPMIRRKDGMEAIRLYKASIERYGKETRYLSDEQREVLEGEIFGSAPLVPDESDADYKANLLKWQRAKSHVKFEYVMVSAIEPKQDALLSLLVTDTQQASALYRAILAVSEVTQEMVFSFIVAEERYYNDRPFMSVLAERVDKHHTKHPDSWHTKAMATFSRHGIIGEVMKMTIVEQCRLMANLFMDDWIKAWRYEDKDMVTT